ncbi:MAG TPA: ferritin [Bacteroidales bacterium]|nr:ferritin [Bacteroidales bacterium]
MVTKKVEKALNSQILKEEHSSRLYLSMASWAERSGYKGAAAWLYKQADEERLHMLKLVHFLDDRGGMTLYGSMEPLPNHFKSLLDVFQQVLKHELFISGSINDVYGVCQAEKDYTTAQFMQWFINEQIEEESTAQTILDKIKLAGAHEGGLFMIDKELGEMAAARMAEPA